MVTEVQNIDSKIDEKIEEKIRSLRDDVIKNSQSNTELQESVNEIKQDMVLNRESMKDEMASTRNSIGAEMTTIREEIKTSESKTNTKLDDNNKKLDENNSKLDELLKMFSVMTNAKTTVQQHNTVEKQQIVGKKRDLQNTSIDDISLTDKRETSFLFISENNPFTNIPFFNNIGWRANKQNTSGILDMEIHDSHYAADESFEKCDNLDYKVLKEGKVNKYKNN
jgi:hypothetical protein